MCRYIRAVLSSTKHANNNAVVLADADYFPFGGPSRTYLANYNQRGYQGEYTQNDLYVPNWVDFNLRMYDPNIGRWLSNGPSWSVCLAL